MGDLGVIAMNIDKGSLLMKSVKNLCRRIQGVYSSHHFLWINLCELGISLISML